MSEFKFVAQTFQIRYGSADVVAALRQTAGEATAPLHVNTLASPTPQALTLQSATGSTRVRVERDNCQGNTQYFNDFLAADAWDLRNNYTVSKLSWLADRLGAAGAQFSLVGLTTLARLRVAPQDMDAIKLITARTFGGIGALAQGALPYDFSVRASRSVDDLFFANLFVNWYQTRVINIDPNSPPMLLEWDMELEEEGLELRFDWNNKLGLFRGVRDWTPERVKNAVNRVVAGTRDDYEHLREFLTEIQAVGGQE